MSMSVVDMDAAQTSRTRSFRDPGDVVDVDNQNATLVTLFLSGKTATNLESQSKKMSLADASAPSFIDLTEAEEGEVEYFPEPPCIAANPNQDVENSTAASATGLEPHKYWKNHVSWREEDPEIEVWNKQILRFRDQWDKLTAAFNTSRCSHGMKRSLIRSSVNSMGETIRIQAFVNISGQSLGIRSASSHDDAGKTGQTVEPGEPVVIEQVVEKEGVRFLKLADKRGWVFDSKDDIEIMAKMEDLEVGIAWYRVLCSDLVDVRRAPIYDESAKTGRLLVPKEIVAVNMKCRVRGDHFVHLTDGRGWVFLLKQGACRRTPKPNQVVMKDCEALFNQDAPLDLLKAVPPTTEVVDVGTWPYEVGEEPVLAIGYKNYGTYLSPGDIVMISKRAYANGEPPQPHTQNTSKLWLRLANGRGWVPERGTDGKMLLKERTDTSLAFPEHYKGRIRTLDRPKHRWMMGTA